MENVHNEKDVFLSIKDLQKIYPNGEQAVYNFNLDIARKEFIVIVGPSGCGKSTTLRMIAGLEDVSEGEIFADGELLNYKPSKDRKIAIVFQSYALYPQMTVYDNIAFPLAMNKHPFPAVDTAALAAKTVRKLAEKTDDEEMLQAYLEANRRNDLKMPPGEKIAVKYAIDEYSAKLFIKLVKEGKNTGNLAAYICSRCAEELEQATAKQKEAGHSLNDDCEVLDAQNNVLAQMRNMTAFEIKKKVFETSAILDLDAYLDKYPRELSGGQMQRVALGRAIVKNVPLFMMDEPLSNLDAKLRLTMRSEIVKIHNRIGATTIYVTHDQAEAMTMASRIVVMSRGFVQQVGTPEEIYDNPSNLFVAKFIGSPAINVMKASYNGADALEMGDGVKLTLPGGIKNIHDDFYGALFAKLTGMLENFDKSGAEEILKIQSALSVQAKKRAAKSVDGKNKLKRLFGKKTESIPYVEEKLACETMAKQVNNALTQAHSLLVCIRPEKIDLRLYTEGEQLAENETLVTASLCELLGAEYFVHIEFAGHEVVAHFPTGTKIKAGDRFVMKFDGQSIMLFDPITGGRLV